MDDVAGAVFLRLMVQPKEPVESKLNSVWAGASVLEDSTYCKMKPGVPYPRCHFIAFMGPSESRVCKQKHRSKRTRYVGDCCR
jgi:hypothetical protein